MASLFGTNAPQYVAPGGTALVSKTTGGLLGMFPGTPDYARPELALAAAPPSAPNGAPSAPRAFPGIEVQIRIPGLLELHGTLSLPPWLPELAPVLMPVLVDAARDLVKRELRGASSPDQRAQGDAETDMEQPQHPTERRSEIEDRVWERD